MKRHNVSTTITNNIDFETGEVLSSRVERKQILLHDEKKFFQVYYGLESILMDLSGLESKVFMALCFHADNEGLVYTGKYVKEEIAKRINSNKGEDSKKETSVQTVMRAIMKLRQKELLKNIGHVTDIINTRYIWNSDSKKREIRIIYYQDTKPVEKKNKSKEDETEITE